MVTTNHPHATQAPPASPDRGQEWVNSIGMAFVWVPAGTFMMGSPETDTMAFDGEKPQHEVTISQGFWLGKYPVTQGQWHALMRTTLAEQQAQSQLDRGIVGQGAHYPMYYVSWDDAQAFLDKLNAQEGSTRYRLPTEAEWEYAARAGATTVYSCGDTPERLAEYAWFRDNANGTTHPVGTLKPNAWGLYDMHGNVWEFVHDWFDATYYRTSPSIDPPGPAVGTYRAFRGGVWFHSARGMRVAYRPVEAPVDRDRAHGFRCVMQ